MKIVTSLPAGKAFVGLENYVRVIETTQFFASFGWTLLITVGSVVLMRNSRICGNFKGFYF